MRCRMRFLPLSRELRRQFWLLIREGLPRKRAAVALGLNEDTGKAWFKQAGGLAPAYVNAPPSDRYMSQTEREELLAGVVRGEPISLIAERMGRHRSTLYRDPQRNRLLEAPTPPGEEVRIQDYRPSIAQ